MSRFALTDLPEKYHASIIAQTAPKDSRRRPHNVLQKLQDAEPGAAHNVPHQAKADGAIHPAYRVTITLRVSDHRRRDADGALSSLMDSLVRAVGRLNPVGAGNPHPYPEGDEG